MFYGSMVSFGNETNQIEDVREIEYDRSVKWGKRERTFRVASRDARISRYNMFEPGNV